jgi:hypothetical protein
MADTPVPANDGDWASDDGGVTARRAAEAFVVDVDGFEGPLDLLLSLARTQKVDLRAISVLALVEQYLAFIEEARALRLELAADYLVMAAWLAFLKSRLLVPAEAGRGRPQRRGHGRPPGVPAGTAGRDARRRGQADGARPAGSGPVRARHAGGHGHGAARWSIPRA